MACVVSYPSGNSVSCGDPVKAIEVFQRKLKEKKRTSNEWVVSLDKFQKLNSPLSDFYTKQAPVRKEATALVKQFIGNTPYGSGECFMWEHIVPVDKLRHSRSVLQGFKWSMPVVRLSDIVPWRDFTIKTFGVKPPQDVFKIKLSWRQFMVMMIEVSYCIMGLDTDLDTVSGHHDGSLPGPEVHQQHSSDMQSQANQSSVVDIPDLHNAEQAEGLQELEILRSDDSLSCKKVVKPLFKYLIDGLVVPDDSLFQVLEIVEQDCDQNLFAIRLSDGEYLVEIPVSIEMSQRSKKYDLNKLDIIKVKNFKYDPD